MASNYWIKLYHEIVDDPKMGRLRDRLWRRAIECFLLAGEQDDGGWLPAVHDMAWRLRADTEQLETELSELAACGILEQKNGGWFVTNFADRQSAMSASERGKRFRERQHKQEYYESATDSERKPNESFADIDTDKDKEEIKHRSRARKPLTPLSDSPADQRTAAIAKVCGLDEDILAHRRLCEEATVHLSNYTPEQILARYLPPEEGGDSTGWNWYVNDWRAPEQPRPNQVVETISKRSVKARASPPANGTGQKRATEPAGFQGIRDFLEDFE